MAFAACWRLTPCFSRTADRVKRCRPLLGTFVEIESDFGAAIDLAFAAVERVHSLMSAHARDSELSRINRGAHRHPVAVSAWTLEVIERSLDWSRASDGRFDIVRAGRIALVCGSLPRHDDQPLPAEADWTAVQVRDGAVTLAGPACLDLGGIAKGFAVDRAIDALRTAGVAGGMVNAGGDLRCFGDSTWPISVVDPANRHPLASIDLIDAALATSAGLPGHDHSLSFDHLPGRDVRWSSVTVRANSACDADALTKIVWAGGSIAFDLLRQHGAEAFAIRADGRVESIGGEAVAA